MNINRISTLFSLIFIIGSPLSSQSRLTLEQAIQTALANNHQIKISQYDLDMAKKQIHPSMVGKSPTVDLNASYEFGYSDARIETLTLGPNPEGGNTIIELNGISNDIILSPEVNLVLLDGKVSTYRLEQLESISHLSELQLRQVMEQTVANVTGAYLQMAQTQSLLEITEASLAFTQDRLNRAINDAKYGTSTSLQQLQIEVDLKTDSANWRNLMLQLANARRDLSRLMGEDNTSEFLVEMGLSLDMNLDLKTLEQQLQAQNTIIALNEEQVNQAEIDIKLAQAAYRPTLQGYANLNMVYLQDDANFLQSNRVIGPNIGVRFRYPIYDGGARKIRESTAFIAKEQKALQKEDTQLDLIKELRNTYAIYQNSKEQLRIERSNLIAFERNLENMNNNYRLGLVNNTDVRAAQLNLDAAKNRVNNYQYTIKQAEIGLQLLAGNLVK